MFDVGENLVPVNYLLQCRAKRCADVTKHVGFNWLHYNPLDCVGKRMGESC